MTKVFAITVKYKSPITHKLSNLISVDNSRHNRGFAGGVNIGIKKALASGATHILLVNPDLKITQANIDELLKTQADIVGPVLKFERFGKTIYDFGGKVNWFLGRPTHWENASGPIEYLSGACLLIKREVIKKIGLFDERFFMYFEDVDFCLRAKRAGFSIAVNPDVVVSHQIAEQRKTHDRFKIMANLRSNWRFILKWQPLIFKPLGLLYLATLFVFVNLKHPNFDR